MDELPHCPLDHATRNNGHVESCNDTETRIYHIFGLNILLKNTWYCYTECNNFFKNAPKNQDED